ncbi:MAG: transporter [Thermoanaerobaculia bacterium]
MRNALVALTLAFAAIAHAQTSDLINADRPGIADSSATVHRGTFQVETGVERDDSHDARVLFLPTLLRYGITNDFELRVESDTWQHSLGDGSAWQPVSIGAKLHFHEHPSLGVIGRVFENGGVWSGDARFVADLDLDDHWSINPNIGIAIGEGSTSALAALTLQYNLSDRWNGFVDSAVQSSPGSALVDAGTAWIIGDNVQLDASIGWGAHGTATPRVFWSTGFSRRF